jgi:hypothetical protein
MSNTLESHRPSRWIETIMQQNLFQSEEDQNDEVEPFLDANGNEPIIQPSMFRGIQTPLILQEPEIESDEQQDLGQAIQEIKNQILWIKNEMNKISHSLDKIEILLK